MISLNTDSLTKKVIEALKFYADSENYEHRWYDVPHDIDRDGGEKAREALKVLTWGDEE